jgi:hypothetical protein
MLELLKTKRIDPESMLKGRMAESLVEEMLRKFGNTVYRFGYEAILQNLTQIEKSFNHNNDAGERIQCIPDFIVLDNNKEPIFLEVKFRSNGELHEKDKRRLKKIKKFWNAKILFVNCTKKPYFEIVNPPYFDDSGEITKEALSKELPWHFDEKIYDEFEELVEKYLKPSLLRKK